MDPDELLAIVEPVPVTNIELGQVEGRSPDDETAAFIMTMVLFFAISTYGAMVLSGVVEEKSSRTVEVLLARMPATQPAGRQDRRHRPARAGPDRRDRHRRARRRVARRLLRRPRGPRQRHRLGGRVVRARLRPLRHRVRHPRIARVPHRRRIERHRPGLDHPRPRLHRVLRGDRQRRHHLGAAGLVVPDHRPSRHAQPHRHGRRDLVGSRWSPSVLTLATIAGLVVLGGRVYTRAILHTGATLSLGEAWRGVPLPAHPDVVTRPVNRRKEVPP